MKAKLIEGGYGCTLIVETGRSDHVIRVNEDISGGLHIVIDSVEVDIRDYDKKTILWNLIREFADESTKRDASYDDVGVGCFS